MNNNDIIFALCMIFFISFTVLSWVLLIVFFIDIAYSSYKSNKTGVKQYWITGRIKRQVCSLKDIILDKVKMLTFSIIFIALIIVFLSFFIVE